MIKIAVVLLILYVFYCGILFLIQRQILFPHRMIAVPAETDVAIPGMEKIWLETDFGKSELWFLPAVKKPGASAGPAVIFAHGNGEVIDFWPVELQGFNRLGIGVLLVEYPGYGRSGGTTTQRSITETFVRAYDVLIKRADVDPARIILVGRSIGGGAVCALAQKRPAAALILMSTFTSARSFATKYLAPGFLVRDPFDNLSTIRSFDRPVLIIHGQKDGIIPYSHGLTLYQAARNGQMITYEAGHNDCPPDWPVFWRDVASFLRESGIIEPTG